jgi:uncharacterized protein
VAAQLLLHVTQSAEQTEGEKHRMDIIRILARELKIRPEQARAAVELMDAGNTVPFIARYRKEKTGSLNDEILRDLSERLLYLRGLETRQQQIADSIREQGKLTPELEKKIFAAETLAAAEDLYRPYRPKRKTRASAARARGLEPLAERILQQKRGDSLQKEAEKYIDSQKEVPDSETALAGAGDILAEDIAERAEFRAWIREKTYRKGTLISAARDADAESVYERYYSFEEPLSKVAGHRVLALNRGEKEKYLTVHIEAPEEEILQYLYRQTVRTRQPEFVQFLQKVIADSYHRLIAPAIERELRNELTDQAEEGAIRVFGKNLAQLLMQPPIAGQTVLGWDPAFRTGCKLAVVDATGKVLDTAVIYPTAPQNKKEEAKKVLRRLIDRYGVTLISLGNGTASRESEAIIAEFLREWKNPVSYVIVNEAGASVYSASRLATEEFPEFDVGQRSAASIARRLQDPLAELVKITPESIGVGQYQHDMNQKKLSHALEQVVEDCVNRVGVDLNTASAALLQYVSGLTKTTAANIVAYRDANGRFYSRRELLKVPKLGPKAYEQCAGFLRIRNGKNPLDATSVHPESYDAAESVLRALGYRKEDLRKGALPQLNAEKSEKEQLAAAAGIGMPTLEDILEELRKPGRDPRESMPKPIFRTDVLEIADLRPGMKLTGTVRNVVDFGAFVDIGVHQDGLVHISQMSDRYIRHPLDVVSVGDIVEVEVLAVDEKKKQIALTMKIQNQE